MVGGLANCPSDSGFRIRIGIDKGPAVLQLLSATDSAAAAFVLACYRLTRRAFGLRDGVWGFPRNGQMLSVPILVGIPELDVCQQFSDKLGVNLSGLR